MASLSASVPILCIVSIHASFVCCDTMTASLPFNRVLQKYMSAFSASKYAVYGLTEALRAEVAQDNIHVGQVRCLLHALICTLFCQHFFMAVLCEHRSLSSALGVLLGATFLLHQFLCI